MLMDAIIKPAREKGLELVRREIPQIGFGEALVKIHYTAICGTDVHIYDWNEWAQNTIKAPMTIGHEFVGEIVEIKGKRRKCFMLCLPLTREVDFCKAKRRRERVKKQ